MKKYPRLRPSPTLAINELSAQLAAEGRIIHRLGFGQSPFPPPAAVVEALCENAWRRDYLSVQGLRELRERVAAFHRDRYELEFTAADVMIGPGSKELIFLLQLVYEGELLLPSPSWVSYEPQARLLDLPVTWLPVTAANGWRLDADTLDRYCAAAPDRPRMLILNYPNNPAGTTLEKWRLEEIARVARDRKLLVVSDEIYGELHHHGRHVSIAKFYPEGTIVTGGLSKWCGAGGWRLGTMCVPPPLHGLLELTCCAASETFSSVSAPVQYAAITAYSAGAEIDRYLNGARRVLAAVGQWSAKELNEAGIPTAYPDGGFYLFPDFTPLGESLGVTLASELSRRMLVEAGVPLLPGENFGRDAAELTCRLAYVAFDGKTALDAAEQTAELNEAFVRRHCAGVTAGIEAMVHWAHHSEPAEVYP
jgi:aspartate aminotransferase